ncbi:hypothetical protein ZIOFF_001013 [Zingiber officinale]|uniref:dUTP diphosphatase n=1 Tax=Zingiber officinale TaxID=94328 RepID=A0A8J5I5B2_ZINOF|nr:hypothetical protein ZIOFF_001013 [Zingiber officinale]
MASRIRSQEPPVTTLPRNTTEEQPPLFEDQVREYRQGQRRRYNAQRRLPRITRSITGQTSQGSFNRTLEQQFDPQVQLRLSMQERASIVPAEVLYHSRRDDAHHRVYVHRSEKVILVTTNQTSILARGYEGWQNSKANILITTGMVGRLSNTPNVGFAYEIQNVVDYLITHGVRALPGRRYNTRELQGQNWIINQSSINIPIQPTEVSTRNMLDGRISIQFDNYQAAVTASRPHYNQRDEEIPSYEEEVQHQIIAVLLESTEILKVKRISSSAILPKRKTEGSAGYDLAINREQFVPKKDKSLLTTGICIQIPKGTYARIAPRSSSALRGLIIMGGVVDEDYRGELILERIATPEVIEVSCLETTARGAQGFGSSTNLAYPSEAPLPKICTQGQTHPECPGCAYCHDGTETAKPCEFYVAPTPGYIDDREYIEYTPAPQKKKQTIEEIFEEYQQFHQEYEWLQRRAMTSKDDPMEITISETRRILRRSRDYLRCGASLVEMQHFFIKKRILIVIFADSPQATKHRLSPARRPSAGRPAAAHTPPAAAKLQPTGNLNPRGSSVILAAIQPESFAIGFRPDHSWIPTRSSHPKSDRITARISSAASTSVAADSTHETAGFQP